MRACRPGSPPGGTQYGEFLAHRRRRRSGPLPQRNSSFSHAGAPAGIYARQALARA
ncbi:hypothetical protein MMG94_08090 [Methylocystis parvus OBBP]|nr:hypothetical protein [Methylocystis parvus]WBK01646.1 hypothetical protein MMG94_08090 [Methylocystis parvus OBBP]